MREPSIKKGKTPISNTQAYNINYPLELTPTSKKQLENANKLKKQTEEKANDIVIRTATQLQHEKTLNDQLAAKNQELQLDVEILLEELEIKESDIKALIQDNNAMFEKLNYLGISAEYDDKTGRMVFI